MKIRRVGAELFGVQRERWTDGYNEAKNPFCNYTNAPNVQLFNFV